MSVRVDFLIGAAYMGMTLEEFKAHIAQPDSLVGKPVNVPFSKHDPLCHLQETGHYTAKCDRCRKLRRRKAERAAARRAAAKPVPRRNPREPRSRDSVFIVSGGLPSLGKGSR